MIPTTSKSVPQENFPHEPPYSLSPSVKVEARYFKNLRMEGIKEGRKEGKKEGRQMGTGASKLLRIKNHLEESPSRVGLLHLYIKM